MSVFLAAIEWQRPWGLAALALPLFVLLLHRVHARPVERATGSLALWRELGRERSARDARARRSLPPRLWMLIVALVLGALALGGPRATSERAPRAWRVVVDRSPSMYLPWRAEDGSEPGGTRLERALELAASALADWTAEEDRLRWATPVAGGLELSDGAELPSEWRLPPELALDAPRWELLDVAGTLWLTDRAPDFEPEFAGLCAAGGGAVPGLVGRDREGGLDWNGELLVRSSVELPPPRVELRAESRLARELVDLLGLWASDRGLSLTQGALELVVHAGAPAQTEVVRAARDGWSLRGRVDSSGAPRTDEQGALAVWLSASDERPLVSAGPGRIHVALVEIEELRGDPAAFALSWARLFDAQRLPPQGACAVAEREAAGRATLTRPAPAAPDEDAKGMLPIAAWLALAATLLAGAALFRWSRV